METILGIGKKDITSSISLTQNEALDAGIKWVGDNHEEDKNLDKQGRPTYVFNSSNKRRQFRMDYGSIEGDHKPWKPHVHFEIRPKSGKGDLLINNHVILR